MSFFYSSFLNKLKKEKILFLPTLEVILDDSTNVLCWTPTHQHSYLSLQALKFFSLGPHQYPLNKEFYEMKCSHHSPPAYIISYPILTSLKCFSCLHSQHSTGYMTTLTRTRQTPIHDNGNNLRKWYTLEHKQ